MPLIIGHIRSGWFLDGERYNQEIQIINRLHFQGRVISFSKFLLSQRISIRFSEFSRTVKLFNNRTFCLNRLYYSRIFLLATIQLVKRSTSDSKAQQSAVMKFTLEPLRDWDVISKFTIYNSAWLGVNESWHSTIIQYRTKLL